MGDTLHEAESLQNKIQLETDTGAVVKESCHSLINERTVHLEDMIQKSHVNAPTQKRKSQPNGGKVRAKQKFVDKALSGLDQIANDDVVIKEIFEEEEYYNRVISRVVQLHTCEMIVVDSSSIQISKLTTEAGIKIKGKDCTLLMGGSAVRMIKLLDLQKVNAHIKSREISNKPIQMLCSLDIDVDMDVNSCREGQQKIYI